MKKILSRINKLFSSSNKLKIMALAGGLFVFLGMVVVVPTLYFRWTDIGTASASPVTANQVWSEVRKSESSTPNAKLVTGFPVYISIGNIRPSLDMNVPVIAGYYDKSSNSWTLSDVDAMFVTTTAQPNNIAGNTFIYGHYRPNVFAYLHLIKPGTLATITTSNGYRFTYKFINSYAVTPSDTSVLGFSASPVLTVQTCSGTFFQNRQMYIFSYVSYEKV